MRSCSDDGAEEGEEDEMERWETEKGVDGGVDEESEGEGEEDRGKGG